MRIPLYQVDAFASRPFSGNPAAVCPLDSWMEDELLQAIAAENNLSETAFFVPLGSGYHLRWFTPSVEVDLCGHATLASAFVLFERLRHEIPEIHFESRSGELVVRKRGDLLILDFPSRPPQPCSPPAGIAEALGVRPVELLAARDYLAIFESEREVRDLQPDMRALATLDRFALIATAPGSDCDFVSRFFAPARGVPEDPVTGSAHCTLIPYWAGRLGKTSLHACQVSRRGGELWCEDLGERVEIGGKAVMVMEGYITL